uniref:Uncharacterized protein n=1 Tax=viral metagenome TaxID=1070528 RepID=A0A6C0E4Z4_9ZZZZ
MSTRVKAREFTLKNWTRGKLLKTEAGEPTDGTNVIPWIHKLDVITVLTNPSQFPNDVARAIEIKTAFRPTASDLNALFDAEQAVLNGEPGAEATLRALEAAAAKERVLIGKYSEESNVATRVYVPPMPFENRGFTATESQLAPGFTAAEIP